MNAQPIRSMDRRQLLLSTSAFVGSSLITAPSPAKRATRKKTVAAIITVYRRNSHADVIVGKVLKGWKHDNGPGPALELSTMYVDQFPDDDLSRQLSKEHAVPVCNTIDEAITGGTHQVQVDGILCIGEHGDYPWNAKEQHLYPRRRFFDQITSAFERCGSVVPVFHDKHLGPEWLDARWIYDQAIRLKVPFMAGSSIPVSYRDPDASLPMGSHVEACVGVGYSGLDIYGFHTLEFLQCFLERRSCAEDGVQAVQCVTGDALPDLLQAGKINRELLAAAIRAARVKSVDHLLEQNPSKFNIFLIDYVDGLFAPVLMLPGVASGISVAVKSRETGLIACRAEERREPRYPHFAYLLKGIEQMIHTGNPSYPVERTFLTSGILDRLLTSRFHGHKRLETPELTIAYKPVDYPYAPEIDLLHDIG